jgi:translation initiation factor 3 subunit B
VASIFYCQTKLINTFNKQGASPAHIKTTTVTTITLKMPASTEMSIEDQLAAEAEELDGYFSDTPLEPEPKYPPINQSFDTAIIITNLPKVPESKLEKLTSVVMKLVSRIGNLASNDDTGFTGVLMPFNDTLGTTNGFAFVEYETVEEAKNAISVLNEYKFDKNHSLSVSPYSGAEKLTTLVETEFLEPPIAPFVEKPNAMSWLEDPNQRDEFVIRYGKETEVQWFDARNDPVVDYDGSREKEAGVSWCEYYCHWSPKGSYLATLVPARGVILWSGSTYEKMGRFVAPDVKTVQFSPQENYMITNNMRFDDENAIKVYHVQSGKLLRSFPVYPDKFPKEEDVPPPPFQWSHDDQYLARMGIDLISIFSTPSMKLLDKKSLLADGIHEFQWSPKANVLSCWVRIYSLCHGSISFSFVCSCQHTYFSQSFSLTFHRSHSRLPHLLPQNSHQNRTILLPMSI